MATQIQKITEKAEKLYETRQIITELETESKKMIDRYKLIRDSLQDGLIGDLNKVGLKSIKTKSGETYTKSVREGVAVVNEALAFQWALKNKAVQVDTRAAAQIIKEMKSPPAGFQKVETEFISVRKSKNG